MTIFSLNVQSLAKYVNDFLDNCLTVDVWKNDVIGFTETQMKLSDSASRIDDLLKAFNMNFNNNDDKFLNLPYGCQDDIAIIISIINLRKDNFTERVFTLMLVYRKTAMWLDEFYWTLEYLLAANSVDVIAGDFN